ncbi:MAG: hypothetical protein ACYC96_15995 [Fimbriimonadaceae bacterium]
MPLRALLGIAIAITSLPCLADSPWSIGDGHALIWQGKPYTPIGLRVDGTVAAIDKAAALGFQDLCVDLPAGGDGWSEAFAELQKHNLTFLVNINSLANFADGYSIEPEGFRITQFKEGVPINVDIPGASSVYAILAASRDGEILRRERVKTPGGRLELKWPMPSEDDAVLILYPRMQSADLPDYFEGLDMQRDRLLRSLRLQKTTTGLRGIVNPLGTIVKLPAPDVRFVPSSPFFQIELARFLQAKYRSVETAEQSWSMRSSDIDTFAKMAQLVPMWSPERGLLDLWNPTTDKLYPIESRRSLAWADIHDVVNTAARRRVRYLTEAIHHLVQVPVVQEWAGWAVPYEGGAMVDGVGMQTRGTQRSELLVGAARAASTVIRWKAPGWLLATHVDLSDATPDAVNGVLEDLISVGARGIFARTDKPDVLKALAAAAARYRAGGIPNEAVRAFFYPEDATFPAEPQQLPGGVWWLPAPYDGNRIELGSRIQAYRFNDGTGDRFVYWVPTGELPIQLLVANPKAITVNSVDGSTIPTKVTKAGVNVTISSTPIVVAGAADIPIPSISRDELADRFAKMIIVAGNTHADVTQEAVVFQNDAGGFDRSPGGSFTAMRTQYDLVVRKLSRYTWIEGESAQSGTLGEHIFYPGCSMNGAYRMETKLNIPGQRYRVSYSMFPKTQADQDVWIAARVPRALREGMRVVVGTQVFSLSTAPVCPYGLGFAWYHLGTTKLGVDPVSVTVTVDGTTGFEMAIDAILITPDKFAPYGARIPDPIPFGTTPTKSRRRR